MAGGSGSCCAPSKFSLFCSQTLRGFGDQSSGTLGNWNLRIDVGNDELRLIVAVIV